MSAETLRTAAAKMRERAESATPGPWVAAVDDHGRKGVDVGIWSPTAVRYPVESLVIGNPNHLADAEHIASWHPAVALAVADWLDLAAKRVDLAEGLGDGIWMQVDKAAVAVANAYLGTP